MPEENLKTVHIPEDCWKAAVRLSLDDPKRTTIQQIVEDALRSYKPLKQYLENS